MQKRQRVVVSVVASLGLLACAAAQAQRPDWNVPIRLPVPTTTTSGTAEGVDCLADACAPERSRERQALSPVTTPLGATIVEFGVPQLPGTRDRPHHGLAFDSEAVRSFMRDAGFSAEQCRAPIMRMHSKMSASTGSSGTSWVYARCSLR